MNIAIFWKPVQWVLDKLWERFAKPKSAVEMLAAMQLREREIEENLPVYKQQIGFAFTALAREHPAANSMSLGALAKALDSSPEVAAEIVRVLVKQKYLEPLRSPGAMGETQYMLSSPITRPRLFRL